METKSKKLLEFLDERMLLVQKDFSATGQLLSGQDVRLLLTFPFLTGLIFVTLFISLAVLLESIPSILPTCTFMPSSLLYN